ncbi:MAG: hypothetical protein HN405_04450 [Planctomycetes bacterium]|jgi:hypothetical protein|nr:hypothetical protein [Planctomycetota bacterium]MBT4029490.1 hypothetical protein [Planctomycetota bacterium]MBT7317704.1 hypothetical protein [Planctomycetota bacterium]
MIKLTLLALAATPAAFLLQDAPSPEAPKEIQVVITSTGIEQAEAETSCCEEGTKDAVCPESGECEIQVIAEIQESGKKPHRIKRRMAMPFSGAKMMKMGDGAHAFMIAGEPGDIDIHAILEKVEGLDLEGLDLNAMIQAQVSEGPHTMQFSWNGDKGQECHGASRKPSGCDSDQECGESKGHGGQSMHGKMQGHGGKEMHGMRGMQEMHGMRGMQEMHGMRGMQEMHGMRGVPMMGGMMQSMRHGVDGMHEAFEILMEAPEAFEDLEDQMDDLEDRIEDMQDQLDRIERLLRNRGGR